MHLRLKLLLPLASLLCASPICAQVTLVMPSATLPEVSPIASSATQNKGSGSVEDNDDGEEGDGFGEEGDGFGEEGDDFGEEGDGFEDMAEVKLPTLKAPPPPSALRVDGFLRSHWAAWTQRAREDRWAKGRQSLDLSARYQRSGLRVIVEGHLEYDLLYPYDARRDEPRLDPEQRAVYERQYIPGQQLIAYRWGSLELSTGRQVVTWGEADALTTLDHINPRDQREPGVADIDDLRLAVWLTRLRFARGPFDLDLIVRHEGAYGLLVPPLADYSPLRSALPSTFTQLLTGREVGYMHDREGVSSDTQSYFLRGLYRGHGLDLGLYAASLIDLQGVFEIEDPLALFTQLSDPNRTRFELPQAHKRFELYGLSASTTVGSWLMKGEVALYHNRPQTVGSPERFETITVEELSTLSWAGSLTYTGLSDLTLSVEYQQGALLGEERELFIPPSTPLLSLRASQSLLRERLSLNLVALSVGPNSSSIGARGALIRADALYKLTDQLKLSAGYVHYLPGDDFGPFMGLDEHARLFTQLRWDFTLY